MLDFLFDEQRNFPLKVTPPKLQSGLFQSLISLISTLQPFEDNLTLKSQCLNSQRLAHFMHCCYEQKLPGIVLWRHSICNLPLFIALCFLTNLQNLIMFMFIFIKNATLKFLPQLPQYICYDSFKQRLKIPQIDETTAYLTVLCLLQK